MWPHPLNSPTVGGGPDIDILRLDIHILWPNINILRPDIHILRPGNDILRPYIMPNGTYERIKKFSDTLPLKIIMYKHYYAQGPPAYPDIHILRPDNNVLRQHFSCKVFIYFRIP